MTKIEQKNTFKKKLNIRFLLLFLHFIINFLLSVSTVGLNTATIQKYSREQEKEDQAMDKLKIKEYSAPFKGSK